MAESKRCRLAEQALQSSAKRKRASRTERLIELTTRASPDNGEICGVVWLYQ